MQKITLAYTIAFFLASLISYPEPIQAQANKTPSNIPIQVGFKQPDYEGDAPSGRDRGTGSRGDCAIAASGRQAEIELIPLIPSDSRGLTLSEFPSVWVKVAYNSGEIEQELTGEFSVEDAQTNIKLSPKRTSIALPKTSGVFRIPIPHSLEVNNWYHWYLVLDCNSPDSSKSNSILSIEGIVKRVSLSESQSQLETKTPQERINVYQDQGIWYDALNETARLSCQNPRNTFVRESWAALLRDVGLDEVTQDSPICSE